MEAKKIIDAINASIVINKIHIVQQGDLTTLIADYKLILDEYKLMTPEERVTLFEEVRKERPLIGRKLKEQLEKDIITS